MYDSMSAAHIIEILAQTACTFVCLCLAVKFYSETWKADDCNRPPDYTTQRQRYTVALVIALISAPQPIFLIWSYNPVRLTLEVSGYLFTLAIFYILVIVINPFLVVASAVYAMHAHEEPAEYAKRNRSTGKPFRLERPRSLRSKRRAVEREDTFGFIGGE